MGVRRRVYKRHGGGTDLVLSGVRRGPGTGLVAMEPPLSRNRVVEPIQGVRRDLTGGVIYRSTRQVPDLADRIVEPRRPHVGTLLDTTA